jgi:alpha-beta hydrolase superfamily lysophospholipase
VSLSSEFKASDATPQSTLKEYIEREKQLFRELKEQVYDRVKSTEAMTFSRYMAGGTQDPGQWQRNWNLTFELIPERIQGGALLLHGLTDSPYSLRRIGEILYARGFYVLGIRLPGHGTVPAALTEVHWEDWVAASRIGARHVRAQIGMDVPFVIAGYSNGGGLAVKYSLDALKDPSLPRPDRLLLFSPEIGIMPVARISNAFQLLSFLPYFEKSRWESIRPEYDPFKYNSFPLNAAQQAYNLVAVVQDQLEEARKAGIFKDFPPVLTFLSWIDSTVETSSTIDQLYGKLENEGSELVVFDMNRIDRLSSFLPKQQKVPLDRLEARADLPYRLTVITNAGGDSRQLSSRSKASRSGHVDSIALDMEWPPGVYSLSHVAVPFSPNDPVYGSSGNAGGTYHGLPLGTLEPRGETDLLIAPLSQLMRLRHNPFFPYIERRIVREIDSIAGPGQH